MLSCRKRYLCNENKILRKDKIQMKEKLHPAFLQYCTTEQLWVAPRRLFKNQMIAKMMKMVMLMISEKSHSSVVPDVSSPCSW